MNTAAPRDFDANTCTSSRNSAPLIGQLEMTAYARFDGRMISISGHFDSARQYDTVRQQEANSLVAQRFRFGFPPRISPAHDAVRSSRRRPSVMRLNRILQLKNSHYFSISARS